jgi:hypothetical protein
LERAADLASNLSRTCASWEKHGATLMDRVAVEYPDRYLGIAAHLIPKEITATTLGGKSR